MQKLIIQMGVVTTLAGALALPVHASPNLRITLDGGYPVSHNNYRYQRDDRHRYDRRSYNDARNDHHARKYQKKQRKLHRRARGHDRGYWRSPYRFDGYNHDRRHSYDRRHHYDRGHSYYEPRRRHH